MNKKEYQKLNCYYWAARSLRNNIENVSALLQGLKRRTKIGGEIRISLYREDESNDRGVYVKISGDFVREALIPPLHDLLIDLKKHLKKLPPVKTVDR